MSPGSPPEEPADACSKFVPRPLTPELTRSILGSIVESSQDAILVLDVHREAILMNERFIELWQVQPEHMQYGNGDARRKAHSQLAADPEQTRALHEMMTHHQNSEYAGEVTLVTGAVLYGTTRPIYDDTGVLLGQLIIWRDRTDFHDVEAERNFFEAHDQVTGLLNRATMFNTIEHRTKPQYRTREFALILIDINRFSRLNEEYGHAFGDRVLHRIAEIITRLTGSRHPVGRHGEDEFMILIDQEPEQKVEEHAQRLLDALSSEIVVDTIPLTLQATIGVSCYPFDGENANDLVSAAYLALQQAKMSSTPQVTRYSQEFGRIEDERRQLELQLSHAAQGTGLELLFQPIYDLRLQELSSCEVLLRWRSKVLGSVSPSVFLPFAEESGLILPIGEWVLRNACAQAAEWSKLDEGAIPVSVNVSPKQFGTPGFANLVANVLAETGCSPFLLILELTETSMAENPTVVSRTIDAIRRLGVKVFIDDFGTGYSSLSYLKHFQVDTLKIDQSFTQAIGQSRQEDALMQATISLAHSLGLNALAEGVETDEQLSFLMNSGCDQVQGFLLNRPMNAPQITDLLLSKDTRLPLTTER